ncbi:MAG: LytR C-terminal domain-containing protein [Ilumatobacteraceae bacterium]
MEPVDAALRNPSNLPSRRRAAAMIGASAALLLTLSACGGDDDDDASSSTTSTTVADVVELTTVAPTVTVAPVTTAPPVESGDATLVTDGATVVVANASGVEGAAGRMSTELTAAGFATGDATNSNESQLNTSKIYYAAGDAQAQAVAESLKSALGGGDIEVLELPDPAPLTDPASIGAGTVLVAMGNDVADQTLDELQNPAAPVDTTAGEATTDSTEPSADG